MTKKNPPRRWVSFARPVIDVAPNLVQTRLELQPDTVIEARQAHVIGAVKCALALAWTAKGVGTILRYLHCLELRYSSGEQISQIELIAALATMVEKKIIIKRDVGSQLAEPVRSALFTEMIHDPRIVTWRIAVFKAEGVVGLEKYCHLYVSSQSQANTVVRLILFAGTMAEWGHHVGNNSNAFVHAAWREILAEPFAEAMWAKVAENLRHAVLVYVLTSFLREFGTSSENYIAWAIKLADADPNSLPPVVRYPLCEVLLLRGDFERVRAFLPPGNSPFVDAIPAAIAAYTGDWATAEARFEALEKPLKEMMGVRKNYLSNSIVWLYPFSLIALGGPARLAKAKKFCLNEQGKRVPEWDFYWGSWGMVLGMKMGDVQPNYRHLAQLDLGSHDTSLWVIQRYLLRAWVGEPAYDRPAIEVLRARIAQFTAAKCAALAALLQSCLNLAEGNAPLPGFFMTSRAEPWREALAFISALDTTTPRGKATAKSATDASRLLWNVALSKSGKILNIDAWQQKSNARGSGWNKPVRSNLSTLARSEKLDPSDAAITRHVRTERYAADTYLDLAGVASALVGHARIVMNSDFSHIVRVSEGTPALEVTADEKNGVWKFLLLPLPPSLAGAAQGQDEDGDEDDDDYDDDLDHYDYHGYVDDGMRVRAEKNELQCIVMDSPDEARLVRFTPAQMRVAQIIVNDLKVPLTAKTELAAAMQVLAAHFELRSETTLGDSARMVAAPTALRAEITPTPSGLALRLVIAPFEDASLQPQKTTPARFAAGNGRARVVMKIGDETVGVERDLALETRLRGSVTSAIDEAGVLWEDEQERAVTRDPESSLKLLEVLEASTAVAAIDWPKGKPVTVTPVTAKQIRFTLTAKKDWFSADATVTIDENQVVRLAEILPLLANNNSRFLQLAPDRYLALTTHLRRQLDDLAALADISPKGGKANDDSGIRLGDASALWLANEIDDWTVDRDAATVKRVAALQSAFAATPAIPAGLQATLRDYQIEGVHWLQRLGTTGFGACLADDMGLGKTVQTLAVLIDRAKGGPTLVIAPTSLIGNWTVEAGRFAPSLRCRVYGETVDEATRRDIVESAVAGEIVLCTYSLMLLAKELFAEKKWHTIVLDEAQAIKNAMAQRSQAVFALQGGFRIALSGTPVENRLEELWSIMRFLNPGLLGTSEQFSRRFVAPIMREQASPALIADPTIRRLKRLIAPFLLRRTKSAVLTDLPERTEITLRAELDAEERSHYELLRRRAEATIAEGAADYTQRFRVLAELMRLRRAACDPRLVHKDWPAAGAKLRLFSTVARDLAAGGHRTLVFSQFTDYLALLGEALNAEKLSYQYLDGSTPGPERDKRVAAFQAGEGQFFLISLKAGGYGLNLTAADYVIIADPWWNPAAEDQAMGRAHRIGQRRPVTAYRLVAAGTIEDRIVDMHASKRALADGLLEGGERAGAVASVDELLALLRED